IVSRSTALCLVLPANAYNWLTLDLNIYVPHYNQVQLYNLLHKHHYRVIHNGKCNVKNYSLSTIYTVTTFGNNQKVIDVIVFKTVSALSPIFQFHSTAIMNFFSADSLYCTYLSLTLHHHAMVN
ncbi:hypothetical protein M404DRAFT_53418, partial [Pisolithus tinctorius Marx 270]